VSATTAEALQAARPRHWKQDDGGYEEMAAGVDSELDRYMQETTDVVTDNGLLFW